jgi:hypothetical protein
VCRHSPKRAGDVEYKRFSSVRCEVQITSVLRHAWSEIEHEWYDLKDAYPNSIKRRFYRLAALLELAESEFLDLRKSKTQYERSLAVQVEAKVPDLSTDALSLRSFIEQDPTVMELDKLVADAMDATVSSGTVTDKVIEKWSDVANAAGMRKLQEVRESLEKYRAVLPVFVRRFRQELYLPTRDVRIGAGSVSKGVSVHNLILLMASLRGAEAIRDFFRAFDLTDIRWDIERQVSLAREVTSTRESSE